ncbi:hypothetical protein [Streptomyces buecherae]|uniref:hypothetical protein n=1 Tax=Streptomyces buecherae TaxID=2763006 RepID=UPI0020B6CDCB|nr:hypothetical protein [Streptomyces buecherae]
MTSMGKPPAALDGTGGPWPMDPERGPARGELAMDESSGRMGVVLRPGAGRVALRALTGGDRWEAAAAAVRLPTPRERLSARIAIVNGRWGK